MNVTSAPARVLQSSCQPLQKIIDIPRSCRARSHFRYPVTFSIDAYGCPQDTKSRQPVFVIIRLTTNLRRVVPQTSVFQPSPCTTGTRFGVLMRVADSAPAGSRMLPRKADRVISYVCGRGYQAALRNVARSGGVVEFDKKIRCKLGWGQVGVRGASRAEYGDRGAARGHATCIDDPRFCHPQGAMSPSSPGIFPALIPLART